MAEDCFAEMGMNAQVRTVRPDEFESFMVFLETCYGHSRGLFPREYPHLYVPREEFCRNLYVIEEGGRIVSHVGVFPMAIRAGTACVALGGIGGVATLPEARGRSHMSTLLKHAIGAMRECGFVLSGLGGDRQRYNAFGWEWCGIAYTLRFTTRSLTKTGVVAAKLREVWPHEALPVMEKHYQSLPYRADRPRLDLLVGKQHLRFWVSERGYVIGAGENRSSHNFLEVASSSGSEPELIRGAMELLYAGEATITISAWNTGQLCRLMRCAVGWTGVPDWCYRIINLSGLVRAYEGVLQNRAEGLRDFDCSLVIRDSDFSDSVTISVQDGKLCLQDGASSRNTIELDVVSAARLILGGPAVESGRIPQGLKSLFPLPLHVPRLDHV